MAELVVKGSARRYNAVMPSRFAAGLAAVFASGLTLAAPAAAEPLLDRVQVGKPGVAATRGFPESLAITLAVPSGYARGCCYDFSRGEWTGPTWRASADPNVGEASRIGWSVDYVRGKSIRSVARSAWADHPQVRAATHKVRHVVDGRTVGRLNGYAVVDAQRSPGAEAQAALAVDLGRKVTALIRFRLVDPPVDSDASFGSLTVNGRPASQWNRRQADVAIASAYVEGLLPPARVIARASGRRIRGKALDQFGGPESTIPVVLQRGGKTVARTTTDRRGGFALKAPAAGRYRVVATLGGSSAGTNVVVR